MHYGKALEIARKQNGQSKKWICSKLGISRVWLDHLIKTGEFKPDKLVIVKKLIKDANNNA